MRLIKLVTVFIAAGLLAGCGEPRPASVSDGECRVFRAAVVETCGLTQADQDAIDKNVEAGIAACRWRRPEPRTPSCDALRAEIAALQAAKAVEATNSPAAAKNRTIMDLLRQR